MQCEVLVPYLESLKMSPNFFFVGKDPRKLDGSAVYHLDQQIFRDSFGHWGKEGSFTLTISARKEREMKVQSDSSTKRHGIGNSASAKTPNPQRKLYWGIPLLR